MVYSRLNVFFSLYISLLIDLIIVANIKLRPHSSNAPNDDDNKSIHINTKLYCECMKKQKAL